MLTKEPPHALAVAAAVATVALAESEAIVVEQIVPAR